jgi:hypothetical protein
LANVFEIIGRNRVLSEDASLWPDSSREQIAVIAISGIEIQNAGAFGQAHKLDDFTWASYLVPKDVRDCACGRV